MQHPYANTIRLRACGLLVHNDALLMVHMKAPTRAHSFWSPPGGGVRFGESLEHTVAREFHEETGLHVSVNELAYIHEFIESPWHAVEFYFKCTTTDYHISRGNDPEFDAQKQIITDVKWVKFRELESLEIEPVFIRKRFLSDFQSGSNNPIWIH